MSYERDAIKLVAEVVELCSGIRRTCDSIEEFGVPDEDTISDYPSESKGELMVAKKELIDVYEKTIAMCKRLGSIGGR